jgi:ADP-heptose:LPS heptosyltransferase
LNIQRVLIFRVGHLGDTVIALPALWAVRRHFSNARITILTNIDRENPSYISPVDVLPEKGLIDDFISYPTNTGIFRSIKALIKLAIRLRRERFDAALYLMPRVRSKRQLSRDRAFFQLAGLSNVKGISFLDKNRLEYPIPFPTPAVEPESEFLLRLVGELGIKPNPIGTDLLLTAEEILAGEKWLAAAVGYHVQTSLIAVATRGKWEFKCWDEDKYLKVVSNLIERKGCYPILFGGSDDREKGDRLIKAWGTGANAAGQLSVRESAVVLEKCKLYLGNDTGTMHLAAAVGLPCVALFSSMDYAGRWSPIGWGHRVFRSNSRCDGCLDIRGDIRHTCMDSIGVDEVLDASIKILDRS